MPTPISSNLSQSIPFGHSLRSKLFEVGWEAFSIGPLCWVDSFYKAVQTPGYSAVHTVQGVVPPQLFFWDGEE